jgi:ribonucleoside-diphosphate reductase alpha chain
MPVSEEYIHKLNRDLKMFPNISPITPDMKDTRKGISRLVMLERYAYKDLEKLTLAKGDLVAVTIKEDPKFPARGIGKILEINHDSHEGTVLVEEEFRGQLEDEEEAKTGVIVRNLDVIDKPLEIMYEQIALRVAKGLAAVETTEEKQKYWQEKFYNMLKELDFVPAGRVLYGAGTDESVTYFNCYVMPFPKDSREGLSEYRGEVMEIMSRGGGVGTNGSTLRPRNAITKGVNGKSSGAISWLDDIAVLTHLVEQGGSRRGAQMMMLNDWHPDIVEFIISKMQNPKILQFIIKTTKDKQIKNAAKNKLKLEKLTAVQQATYEAALKDKKLPKETQKEIKQVLKDGGHYTVKDPDFLSGANISVCITKDFMDALDRNGYHKLQFPDIENYSKEEMEYYDKHWHEVGDVREWAKTGHKVRTHRKIKAKELWNLINICATYSAEPGIFFIDNANDMTNARAYGQKVVATNPCGEQPLAPYAVCNLSAVNLANMVNKETKEVDFEKLKETVSTGVRLQDNVISATPYFLEANRKQALGERRVGLGVMGLADLLIYCEKEYGSKEGNDLIDKIFEVIATTAYRESIELAKEKGSFPFLADEDGEGFRKAFIDSGYMETMPEDIRQGVLDNGIRNSHLLTIAPTGSTGTLVGVATGLEPYFSFKYYRSGRLGKFIEVNADIVKEYLEANPEVTEDNLPSWFVSSMGISPEGHADAQCVIQRWIDSSISKTVNAPKGYSVEQVEKVYERLYRGGAKGGTVYVDGSRDSQVLTLTAEENDLSQVDFDEGEHEEPKTYLVNSIQRLEDTNVTIGDEIGDTCPNCRKGKVRDIGGCHTCDNCNAQLRCGL